MARNTLYVKFRKNWSGICEEDDVEVLRDLDEDLAAKAADMGAVQVLTWLEDTASHFFQLSARTNVQVGDFEDALNRLFRQHVLRESLTTNASA